MAEPNEEKKKKEQEEQEEKELAKAAGKPSAAAIARAIEGLTFRTNKALPVLDDSTGKPVQEGGRPKMRHIPDLRPMTADDVLKAYFDNGQVVLVSKDGSKHRIGK